MLVHTPPSLFGCRFEVGFDVTYTRGGTINWAQNIVSDYFQQYAQKRPTMLAGAPLACVGFFVRDLIMRGFVPGMGSSEVEQPSPTLAP